MDNLKVKLYITLDTLLEFQDGNYSVSENSCIKNKFFIESLSRIAKEFPKLLEIVFIIKNDKNVENCKQFIKNNINNFTYEIELYKDNKDFLESQKIINKTKALIDIDDDLLYQWEKRTGKAIKYITESSHKLMWDCLYINNNYDSSEIYYNKFINFLHLYH